MHMFQIENSSFRDEQAWLLTLDFETRILDVIGLLTSLILGSLAKIVVYQYFYRQNIKMSVIS